MASLLSQKCVFGLAIGSAVLLGGLAAPKAFAQYEDYLLPDMMPWISDSRGYSHSWNLNFSETEFSSTTTPLNTGVGHLEVHDDLDQSGTGGSDIDIYQRLYHADGGASLDVLAGNFINHSNHGHFHFEGYSVQRLRNVGADNSVGSVAAEGEKTSFCMIDLAGFGGSSNYFGCGRGTQGISAGYGDVYSSGLDGQQIDVSGLSRDGNGNFNGGLNGTGVYWFEIIIDPENRMIESNNFNNFAHLLIDLNGSEGAVLDDHANAQLNATVLQSGNGAFDDNNIPAGYRFGEIGQEGDVDFFSANVREGALYMISMEELQMEYSDIKIFGTSGSQVFTDNLGSSGQQTTEYQFRADGDGDYFIEVGETRTDFGNRDGSYLLHFEVLKIAGDANGDDVVNAQDLDLLLATWGDSVAAGTGADFNGDGFIDGDDQAIIENNFGSTLADYSTTVPEPGSIALLGLGGLALLRRRRR